MVRRKFIFIVLIIVSITSHSFASEKDDGVVSLGEDLTVSQREQIFDLFDVRGDIAIIKVTNREERIYLGRYIDEDLIGTRAISCAYVRESKKGSGIDVEIYNITWVTREMYMNALVTAGISDAQVKIAAPVKVSGTAALTGIIKAFENVSGRDITEREKEVANEEIAKTGQLGEDIGQNKASQLIKEIKEEIINKNLKDKEDIRKVVIQIAGDLNINLNTKQVDEITTLMERISRLDLNISDMKVQLKGISNQIKELARDNQEVKSWLQRILDFLKELFSGLSTWLSKLTA